MPSEVSATDSSQSQQPDKMSAVTQKQYGDMQQSTTTFSYAQAAKGRSPSIPLTSAAGKASSDTTEIGGKRASSPETRNATVDSNKDSTKRTASEGRLPHGNDFKTSQDDSQPQSFDTKDPSKDTVQGPVQVISNGDISPEKPSVAGQSQSATSLPSSPEYGTTSTSTLPKEDDIFSTANGSSDSTSDKQSQTSQGSGKPIEKGDDDDKGRNVTASWDDELPVPATAPVLKEAAPPPVNVWQIRSQNQAKSKASATSQQPKPTGLNSDLGNSQGPGKSQGTNTEVKKPESKKKAKAVSGVTEDRSPSGPGNKSTDVSDKDGSKPMAPLLPSGDAVSWPTPDSATGDGKKRNQDRAEKIEKDSAQPPKPHGKEKWVPVPYVPTAVFNTPIPTARRGGRGALRGGREGESRGRNPIPTGNVLEKSTVAGASNTQASAVSGQDRHRAPVSLTPANSSTSKPKRASSAGPITPREQRKPGELLSSEKIKDNTDAVEPKAVTTNINHSYPSRRPSAPTVSKDQQTIRYFSQDHGKDASWSSTIAEGNKDGNKGYQNEVLEPNGYPRASGPERRNDGSGKPEFARDFQGSIPARERGEPRVDRGRGGFRGRGGATHNNYNSNLSGLSNGLSSHYQPTPASSSKSHSNHDRLPTQAHGSSFQPAHSQPRHYRNNSRSQSIPYSNQYSRFSNGHHGGPPHLANLQTDLANDYGYLPAHQGAMTAMPFNSYGEQQQVFGMVNLQMNYYFSVENLCKDMYLRSHMDSQGFVFLELLAQFNRIKQLTNDMDLVRWACQNSQTIEYVNVDGTDRVRAREGWQQWVRKMEERDPSAQNDGPALQSFPQYSQTFNYIPSPDDRQMISPRSNLLDGRIDTFQHQHLNGSAPSFGPYTSEQNGFDVSETQTPHSAAVTEFPPSVRSTGRRNFYAADHYSQETRIFTDAEVDNMDVVVRRPLNAATAVAPPFYSPSGRTFSNGSIDGRSINDELSKFAERQARPVLNGDAFERWGCLRAM